MYDILIDVENDKKKKINKHGIEYNRNVWCG